MARIGIILAVTGVIVPAHYFVGKPRFMTKRSELIIAIGLLVVGLPLLLVAS